MGFDTNFFLDDTKNKKVLFKTTDNELNTRLFKNNQYGMAMTMPLLYGCIKKQNKLPNFRELEQLLKSITLEDKIGNLFTVHIEFFKINPKTLLFNEIFPPIFEKQKKIPPHMRSCSQIMGRAQKKKDKDDFASLPFNSKTHATLNKKKFCKSLR